MRRPLLYMRWGRSQFSRVERRSEVRQVRLDPNTKLVPKSTKSPPSGYSRFIHLWWSLWLHKLHFSRFLSAHVCRSCSSSSHWFLPSQLNMKSPLANIREQTADLKLCSLGDKKRASHPDLDVPSQPVVHVELFFFVMYTSFLS